MSSIKIQHLSRSWSLVLLVLLVSIVGLEIVSAQDPAKKPAQGMGVSTGTAVTYSTRRTVGVTDANAPVVFEEIE